MTILNFKGHIKALSAKIGRAVGFLKHTINFLTQNTLKTVCTGIVEPHFRYCCPVLGNYGATENNHLKKLQNRTGMILTNSHFDADFRPLLNTLGLKSIQDLIDTEIRTMVFKALYCLAPKYLSNLFVRNSEGHLRVLCITNTDLQLPEKATNSGQNAFHTEMLSHGMPFHLKLSRHLPCRYSKQERNKLCSSSLFCLLKLVLK